MKIKGKEIQIGNLVIIRENYDKNRHFLSINRISVGWVQMMEDRNESKGLEIFTTKSIDSEVYLEKLSKEESFWKALKNIPKLIGLSSLNKSKYFSESSIESIEIIKK